MTETGDYAILARHREPGPDDIAAAEASLSRLGLAGWLAIMSQSLHTRGMPELVMVRTLHTPTTPFDLAVKRLVGRYRF